MRVIFCVSYEEEDACVPSSGEMPLRGAGPQDLCFCVSYEEEDACVAYAEEDACVI